MDIDINELMRRPDTPDRNLLAELRTLVSEYPYYQTARILYLRNLFALHDPSFGDELRKAALYISDRSLLFKLVEGDNYTISRKVTNSYSVSEASESSDRTETLIDKFLSTTIEEPRRAATSVSVDSSKDYIGYLLQKEKKGSPRKKQEETSQSTSLNGHNSLIDDYINKAGEQRKLSEVPEYLPEVEMRSDGDDSEADEEFFTETLAKIYIKQGRYEKAIEIISKLSLIYPKKNSYFADQLRFLQKIVINNKYKQQKNV